MVNYTFLETLKFFSVHLDTEIPKGELEKEGIEIEIDKQNVVMLAGKIPGSISLEVTLGLFLRPISTIRLKEIMTNNFLGIGTGGCTLTLDDDGVALGLKIVTTPTMTPQESWECLHRLLGAAREWLKLLSDWDEFIPLNSPPEEKTHEEKIGEKV
ncbi:MAG: type III secretion system chaperone [Chlamydiia bacterium]|nr:type III secretion system chaperone [Chlamydiia bacterium]